jgi:hypothetical protein
MRAALILVGVGTLALMELEAPPRATKPVSEPSAGSGVSRDTLTTADRLEIPHMQHEAPVQPNSSSEPKSPPDQAAITAREPPKIVAQQKRGANAEKLTVVLPRPRPKHGISKATANPGPSKPIVEVKSCRPNAFDGLLKALNLSGGCET